MRKRNIGKIRGHERVDGVKPIFQEKGARGEITAAEGRYATRLTEAERLLEVFPADGGDRSVTVHEAVLLLNTDHGSNETEGEPSLNGGVVVQERSSLGSERGNVAPVVAAGKVLFS